MIDFNAAAVIAGKHCGTIADWLDNWCGVADRLLVTWENWIANFRTLAMDADSIKLNAAIESGEPIVASLKSLMAERKAMLTALAVNSLQECVSDSGVQNKSSRLLQLKRLENRIASIRQQGLSQWISTTQTVRFVDELLFIVRSGQRQPATYATNEMNAFQGGFILDSTA